MGYVLFSQYFCHPGEVGHCLCYTSVDVCHLVILLTFVDMLQYCLFLAFYNLTSREINIPNKYKKEVNVSQISLAQK